MAATWEMQDAKAKFGQLIKRAASEGPQVVTHRGVEAAVVLSMEDFRRLEAGRPSLVEYLIGGPKLDDETIARINDRPVDTGRDVEL